MSFPPEIYLIGAQRSGTTTLAYLLSQHPNVCVAKSKEPHFFSTYWDKGLDWYQAEFPDYKDAVCIDASTTYSMAPLSIQKNSKSSKTHLKEVPKRIYSINPNARFIYLLRDPVERTYSAYWHYVNTGREQKDFGEVIRNDYFYLDVSNYYGQLIHWLKYFPIESFKFLLFEDMRKDFEQVAKDCFKFIGVDPEGTQVFLEEIRNKSRPVNIFGRQFNRLFKTLDYSGFGYAAPSFVRGLIHKLTTDYDKNIPALQEKDKAFIRDYFAETKHDLELMTGLSLNKWQE